MGIPIFTKQPADSIDIDINMSEFLPSSDTILTARSATESGLTLGTTSINTDTKIAKQFVAGGTSGNRYKVTMTITSVEGRVKEVDFYIKVKEL